MESEKNIEKTETVQTSHDIPLVVLDLLTHVKINMSFCHVLSLDSFHWEVLEPIPITWILCQPPPKPNDEGYLTLWSNSSQIAHHSIKGHPDLGITEPWQVGLCGVLQPPAGLQGSSDPTC